jgi:hypothetical protein
MGMGITTILPYMVSDPGLKSGAIAGYVVEDPAGELIGIIVKKRDGWYHSGGLSSKRGPMDALRSLILRRLSVIMREAKRNGDSYEEFVGSLSPTLRKAAENLHVDRETYEAK